MIFAWREVKNIIKSWILWKIESILFVVSWWKKKKLYTSAKVSWILDGLDSALTIFDYWEKKISFVTLRYL